MTKKIDTIQGAVIISRIKPKLSAYTCADIAIKLASISAAVSQIETFSCNGFKNEWHDRQFAQYARDKNVAAANALQSKILEDGETYYDKRKAAIKKKIEKIKKEYSLDIVWCGLSGVAIVMDQNDSKFYF
jgi:hypothetical protein